MHTTINHCHVNYKTSLSLLTIQFSNGWLYTYNGVSNANMHTMGTPFDVLVTDLPTIRLFFHNFALGAKPTFLSVFASKQKFVPPGPHTILLLST